VSRQQIVAFLRRVQCAWREDLSNRDVAFLRNRVRHELLPVLEQRFNPSVRDALRRTADILGEENQWMNLLAGDILQRAAGPDGSLSVAALRGQPAAACRRVFRLWLVAAGYPAEHLNFDLMSRADRLIRGRRGSGQLSLPAGFVVRRQYDRLAVEKRRRAARARAFRLRVKVPGETLAAEHGFCIHTSIAPGIVKDPCHGPGALPARASLRLSAVGRKAVFVRNWRPGDRMSPFGMPGTKKLQDIFVDAKIPAQLRNEVPIVACGDEVIWIPGYRIARGWEILDPTSPALQIQIEERCGQDADIEIPALTSIGRSGPIRT
jgi:tRNA(Ile)-lysidine synthase